MVPIEFIQRARKLIDWKRIPHIAAWFENRPDENIYWRELIQLAEMIASIAIIYAREKIEQQGQCVSCGNFVTCYRKGNPVCDSSECQNRQ